MAWPTIQDHFAAMAIFRAPSGLPSDVFTNTWYFRNRQEPSITSMGERIERVLKAFYDEDNGGGHTIAEYMPQDVINQGMLLKVYDLGKGPPRTPDYENVVTFDTTPPGGAPMPREVAVCLSYYAGRGELEPPVNYRRRRGRLYIGPFMSGVLENTTAPRSTLLAAIADGAENVLNTTEDVKWCQLSTTNASFHYVTGGWVDNAWDTQRSRGNDPTARITWGAPRTT